PHPITPFAATAAAVQAPTVSYGSGAFEASRALVFRQYEPKRYVMFPLTNNVGRRINGASPDLPEASGPEASGNDTSPKGESHESRLPDRRSAVRPCIRLCSTDPAVSRP